VLLIPTAAVYAASQAVDQALRQATGAQSIASAQRGQALGEAASAQAMASAVAAQSLTHVTGHVHAAGGDMGSWDIVLSGCQSGEQNGFYGVDFYVAGNDNMRLRYVHDEAMGEVVKIAIPSKPGTAAVFDRTDRCSVLEGSIEKTNVSTWTPRGKIRHLNGQVKFDCKRGDGGHVTGEATFAHCH